MVAIRHDIDHPDAEQARERALRGLRRPGSKGLLTSFRAATGPPDMLISSGLWTGRMPGYQPDPERLCRTANRITAGLFYHETGRRLPDGYEVTTWIPSLMTPEGRAKLQPTSHALASGPPKFIGRRVLSYRWLQVDNGDVIENSISNGYAASQHRDRACVFREALIRSAQRYR
jgi:hypothetical protein